MHVVGYHGTTLTAAEEMEAGRYIDSGRGSRWLGSGIYFFENDYRKAAEYADQAANDSGTQPALLQATIDISRCLDLTNPDSHTLIRTADQHAQRESNVSQMPLTIQNDEVIVGYSGLYKDYGKNIRDYRAIEKAVELGKNKHHRNYNAVRGIFIEGMAIYSTSYFYSHSHIAIAVRPPFDAIVSARVISF